MANRARKKTNNLWGTITDVLIASMNKGQFGLAVGALLMIVMVWKMPPEAVGKLAMKIEEDIANGALAGYLAAGGLALGWSFHARWQRKTIASEMDRIGAEKSKLQGDTLSVSVESSSK